MGALAAGYKIEGRTIAVKAKRKRDPAAKFVAR